MKKILVLISIFITSLVFSQSIVFPNFINYQAVLRDASGNVLSPGTTGTIKFRLYDDMTSTSPSYEEDQSFTTSSVGMVNLQIGKGTPIVNSMPQVNWSGGKASYEVYLNGSTTPISLKQPFASVPYAIYSMNSGNSLPLGSANQTLFWDGTQSQWVATSNLNNNGTNVGIGISPAIFGNKLHVHSINSADTSVVLAYKNTANARDAAVRGISSGSSSQNISNPNSTSIYGGDFISGNSGTGYAVGASGIGASGIGGTGVGLSGIATGGATSTLIGVYGDAESVGGYNPNAFAAVFNKGKVVVLDTIMFPNSPAPVGAVFTLNAQKKGIWSILSASSPINIAQGGIVNVNPLTPSTSFTISAPPTGLSILGNSITITQGSTSVTQTISALTGTGTIGYLPEYSSSSTFSISNIFRNGTNQIGVNTISPKTFFHIFKQAGADTLLLESPNGSSMSYALKNVNNRFGLTLNGANLKIEENGVDRMIFSSGNVGIGIAPTTKLHVAGNTLFADVNTITGYVSVIQNNVPAAGQSGGVLRLSNNNARSISNDALLVENFATKVGGSGSTKTGIEIQSTGSWAPTTGQTNVGLLSNVSGADNNYSAIFTGGQVGIANSTPKNTLSLAGSMAVSKVTVSNNYSVTPSDYIVEASAFVVITLVNSAIVDEGTLLVIRNRSGVNITVNPFGTDFIQRLGSSTDLSTTTLNSFQVLRLYKSGTRWIEM